MKKEKTSEFGKGLGYCLGLFLAHAERDVKLSVKYEALIDYSMWFNASSDHLFELVIPRALPKEVKERLKVFKTTCITWGHGFTTPATKENYDWAIAEAKVLLRLIDKSYGIKVVRGDFE